MPLVGRRQGKHRQGAAQATGGREMLERFLEHWRLGNAAAQLLEEHGAAVAAAAAAVGWTLYLWERAKVARTKRELALTKASSPVKDSATAEVEPAPERPTPSEHAEVQSAIQQQIRQLKAEVVQGLCAADTPPCMALLEEEHKLAALQAELEALHAEIRLSCPRAAGSSQGGTRPAQRGDPYWYTAAISSPAGSASSSTSRSTSMAGLFQQRLRPLDVADSEGDALATPASKVPASPDLRLLLCGQAEDDDATTWLMDSAQKAAGGATVPDARGSNSSSPAKRCTHMQLLGMPSPLCHGRRAAGMVGGTLPRRSASVPSSPRVSSAFSAAHEGHVAGSALRRPSGYRSEAGTPLPAVKSAPDAAASSRLQTPPALLLHNVRREGMAFSRSPGNLSDGGRPGTLASQGKQPTLLATTVRGSSGSKIPRLPASNPGSPAAGTPTAAAAAAADFKIATFRSAGDEGARTCSPAGTEPGCVKASKLSLAISPSGTASRIPKPAVPAQPEAEAA